MHFVAIWLKHYWKVSFYSGRKQHGHLLYFKHYPISWYGLAYFSWIAEYIYIGLGRCLFSPSDVIEWILSRGLSTAANSFVFLIERAFKMHNVVVIITSKLPGYLLRKENISRIYIVVTAKYFFADNFTI